MRTEFVASLQDHDRTQVANRLLPEHHASFSSPLTLRISLECLQSLGSDCPKHNEAALSPVETAAEVSKGSHRLYNTPVGSPTTGAASHDGARVRQRNDKGNACRLQHVLRSLTDLRSPGPARNNIAKLLMESTSFCRIEYSDRSEPCPMHLSYGFTSPQKLLPSGAPSTTRSQDFGYYQDRQLSLTTTWIPAVLRSAVRTSSKGSSGGWPPMYSLPGLQHRRNIFFRL